MDKKEMIEIEKAEQQITGYCHAKYGYCIEELVNSMGLEKLEWIVLKEYFNIKSILNEQDFHRIESMFEEVEDERGTIEPLFQGKRVDNGEKVVGSGIYKHPDGTMYIIRDFWTEMHNAGRKEIEIFDGVQVVPETVISLDRVAK